VVVVETGQFIDDRSGLLARCGIVKIGKRFLVDYAIENREIMSDSFDIVRLL
jgi:hypothetical protein